MQHGAEEGRFWPEWVNLDASWLRFTLFLQLIYYLFVLAANETISHAFCGIPYY
jgi:hypothetical protein